MGAAARTAGVLGAVALIGVAAPAARAADPSVSVTYKGALSEKYVAKVSNPSDYEVEVCTLNGKRRRPTTP